MGMTKQFPPVQINFASVQVKGGPGLTLVALVVAIAIEFPEVRWLLLSGLAGGLVVAAALIYLRHHQVNVATRCFPALRNGGHS